MAFCEFSTEVVSKNVTTIDNIFISDFMPNASENCVKVYLYGLYKCSSGRDNTLEQFEKALGLSADDIVSIFYYWQELGLVQVINVEPIQVKYLPMKNALQKMKKYNVDKYTAFNISAQEIMGSKMLTPREFEEFYYIIENLKMEKEALLKIIDYCVKFKGENIAVSYVVAVAKNWAHEGVLTSEDVDERLETQERISGDVVLVMKAMGLKRSATIEEYQMYIRLIKDLEMSLEIITHVAKSQKVKTFKKLEDLIMKCYSLRLESIKEIDDYFASVEKMFGVAKKLVKKLGLWYDDLSMVVDTYITSWLQLGFDEDALLKLGDYSFRASVRTLEGFNKIVNTMFKQGIITSGDIDNYIADIVRNDGIIKQILECLGILREVNSVDRSLFKTWTETWGMSEEVLKFACSMCDGKYLPMQYLNKILSECHTHNLKTLDDVKKHKFTFVNNTLNNSSKTSGKEAKKREYSKKELDSLFDNIEEVEI
ncbi:MAG: DnaD domain protein [Clostridiales bacterium]|nr:DnaD domain protein [Clostridiales bacterium]